MKNEYEVPPIERGKKAPPFWVVVILLTVCFATVLHFYKKRTMHPEVEQHFFATPNGIMPKVYRVKKGVASEAFIYKEYNWETKK